jgi:hypothetical protein
VWIGSHLDGARSDSFVWRSAGLLNFVMTNRWSVVRCEQEVRHPWSSVCESPSPQPASVDVIVREGALILLLSHAGRRAVGSLGIAPHGGFSARATGHGAQNPALGDSGRPAAKRDSAPKSKPQSE